MSKKRLTNKDRESLKVLVEKRVTAQKEAWEMKKKERVVEDLLIQAYNCQFPIHDMHVLEKYGFAYRSKLLQIAAVDKSCDKVDHFSFTLSQEKLIPFFQPWSSNRKARLKIPYDREAHNAIRSYENAKLELQKRLEEIKQDYYKLIDCSKYFEEVVEVWEEASELEEAICSRKEQEKKRNSNLSDEVKARIKKDAGLRKNDSKELKKIFGFKEAN